MNWYDLRQHALMQPERATSDALLWRAYMRLLAMGRRPDRPAEVFPGLGPGTTRTARQLQRYRRRPTTDP